MEKIELNQTPVRTARNFNINNIKLENINIPTEIKPFSNFKIIGDNSKVEIKNKSSKAKLTYGLEESLTSMVNNNSNLELSCIISSKTNKETQIVVKLDKDNLNLIENIELIAEPDSKATVIIKYEQEANLEAFNNGIIRCIAKENANISVIIINLLNKETNNFLSIQNELDKNSNVKYTIIDFGGKNSITNYYANLIGDNSNNILNTIYLGKQEQLFDLNYIAELRGKKTNIDIEVQGALKDSAKKHFKGTIDFKKGCKKAKGNEKEECMLLSDTARSLALPMLLCSEEDVEGNHSSSAGKIGEKEMFYIMSRGFNKSEAMKLMVRAKFNKILENIKNEELLNDIETNITRILENN